MYSDVSRGARSYRLPTLSTVNIAFFFARGLGYSMFRIAAILQGIVKRADDGTAADINAGRLRNVGNPSRISLGSLPPIYTPLS